MISSADEKDEAGHVFIRVVFVGDKAVETRPGVRKEGTNVGSQVAEKYKYRAKGKTLNSIQNLLSDRGASSLSFQANERNLPYF